MDGEKREGRDTMNLTPTPHPDVNNILNLLLTNVKEILRDQFVGMYLYGSLSSGDFDPDSSDIDFLVVTTDDLSETTVSNIEAMHRHTWSNNDKRAGKLEGAYVPENLIRVHDPHGRECPTVNEGKFYRDRLGSDWIIQRHVVREFGVIVEGPDPKIFIDFVSPEDIRNAVKGILREWWFPMLENDAWLRENSRGYHSYAILSMCRAMHALEHGTIVSKPVAAKWAQAKLGERWHQVIDLALIARKPVPEEFDLLNPAIELIQYVRTYTE
jgi:predicted nucleotidyltransferase